MDRHDPRHVLDVLAEIERREAASLDLAAAPIAETLGVALPLVQYVLRARERGQPPRLLGRYGLVEAIGHGAMGVVWWARDFELAREVALKELSPTHARNPEAVRRFRREAAAAARLSHPSLLPIYEIGNDGDTWFYSMKLVQGSSLHEQVEMSQETGRPGPAGTRAEQRADFLERYACVADAVQVAHDAGVLHRDIKPSNIMVDEDGTLLLVDFGLARDLDREPITQLGASMGTPMYMSPEQFAGRTEAIDARTDVYALGITLYEVLTLRAPYEDSSLGEMAQQVLHRDPPSPRGLGLTVPLELEHIIFHAIEKEPARRYPSAAAFAADLRNYIHDRPIVAEPQGRLVRLGKRLRRNRSSVRAALATIGTLLLAGLVVWGGYGCWDSIDQEARDRALREVAGRGLREGRLALAEGRSEDAQARWARTFAKAPSTGAGRDAMLALARSLLDEARPEAALQAADYVLRSAPDRRQATLARFLGAQGALGAGAFPVALGYLALVEARADDLEAADRERLAALRVVAATFTPTRSLPLPRGSRFKVGRFRGPAPLLVAANAIETQLMRLADGVRLEHGLERRALVEGAKAYRPIEPDLGVADVDGDGVDELILVTRHDMSIDESQRVVETLRILDLRSTPPTVRFEAPVRGANHDIHVGDVDNDGLPDILLGMSYPVRGIRILRGVRVSTELERWAFEEIPPEEFGDLLPLRDRTSDVRALRVGDLSGDGDGHAGNDLVVVLDQHWDYALHAFHFDRATGFAALADPLTIGSVHKAELVDLDGAGSLELVYGMTILINEGVDSSGWPPQGLYRVRLHPEQRVLGPSALVRHRDLRVRPSRPSGPKPTNLGFASASAGRFADGGRFVASRLQRSRAKAQGGSLVLCAALRGSTCHPVLLGLQPPNVHATAVLAADVDADGDDEILGGAGERLYLYGTGSAPAAAAPPSHEDATPLTAGPGLSISIANFLAGIGFHAEAARIYGEVLPFVRGDALEGEAVFGTMRGLTKSGQLEAAVELLAAEMSRDSAFRVDAALERAHLLEDLDRLKEAAVAYGELAREPRLLGSQRDVAQGRHAALQRWLQLESRELPPMASGRPSREGTFAVTGPRSLRIEDDRARGALMRLHVPWQGESFRLVFDLRIAQLEVSQNLSVGFLDPSAEDPIWGALLVRVSSTSGQRHSLGLSRQVERPRPGAGGVERLQWGAGGDSSPGMGLLPDRWYRFVMTHDRSLPRSRLRVIDRDERSLVASIRSDERGAQPPGKPYELGIHASHMTGAGALIDAEIEFVSLEMIR